MVTADRFSLRKMQKQTVLQPECPVYIHCSRLCTEKGSGSNFLQVRMVNRSDRLISSVFLGIAGLNADGDVLFTIREMVLSDCNAMPHAVFGEKRLLALGHRTAAELQITVERVIFADGMIWRKLPGQQLTSTEEAGWLPCRCGMKNPPGSPVCALCGSSLLTAETPKRESPRIRPMPPVNIPVNEDRPAPIVRHFVPEQPEMAEEERGSKGLYILLLVLSLIAVLAVGGFLYWCFEQNLI